MAKDLTASLDALMRRKVDGGDSGDNSIPAVKPRGEFPSTTSAGIEAKASGSGGQGLNPPFTEISREYYTQLPTFSTSDGVFRVRFHAIKQIKFEDAAGKTLPFNLNNLDV